MKAKKKCDNERIPAESFHPGEFVEDEIKERGWSERDLAERMGGDVQINEAMVALLIHCPMVDLLMGEECANGLSRAFGTGPEVWMNLDASWQKEMKRRGVPSGACVDREGRITLASPAAERRGK